MTAVRAEQEEILLLMLTRNPWEVRLVLRLVRGLCRHQQLVGLELRVRPVIIMEMVEVMEQMLQNLLAPPVPARVADMVEVEVRVREDREVMVGRKRGQYLIFREVRRLLICY